MKLLRQPALLASTFLVIVAFARAPSLRAAPNPTELAKQTVLEAVQRGVLGQLPAQFAVQDVTFTEVSRVDTEITLKGDATFVANEDTYLATRRLGLKRPSGDLRATVLRLVHRHGATFSAPFQAVVSLLDPAPRIVPRLDVAAQGQPRARFKAVVIEGSPEHQQLLALDQAFVTADERFQRVKEKWDLLLQIRSWLTNYDAFVAVDWGVMKQRLIHGLDSRELGLAYEKQVAPQKKFPNRQAQHAAFIKLVQPAFDPEFVRIREIAEARESAAQAYIAFLEQR